MTQSERGGPARRWWYITRKFPPAIGGMERLSWEVTRRLGRRRPLAVVAASATVLGLPKFMASAAVRVLAACIRGRMSLLHLGDPVLAPLGLAARAFGIPTSVTIHGLDVAYRNPLYRIYRALFLGGFDAYVCISEAARGAAIEAGVPNDRITIIGIGIDVADRMVRDVRRDDDRLLFIGRLVPRKGLYWFVENVLPRLAATRSELRLAILGEGPERARIERIANAKGVGERLIWLGEADDVAKAAELARATLCVMPNVAIAGDPEGFGIVALEAAAAGCPLLAARVDGLKSAVADDESGTLLPPGDADAWCEALARWLDDPLARAEAGARARAHVLAERAWDPIIDRYERLFVRLSDAPP